jgi:hypothetical protein
MRSISSLSSSILSWSKSEKYASHTPEDIDVQAMIAQKYHEEFKALKIIEQDEPSQDHIHMVIKAASVLSFCIADYVRSCLYGRYDKIFWDTCDDTTLGEDYIIMSKDNPTTDDQRILYCASSSCAKDDQDRSLWLAVDVPSFIVLLKSRFQSAFHADLPDRLAWYTLIDVMETSQLQAYELFVDGHGYPQHDQAMKIVNIKKYVKQSITKIITSSNPGISDTIPDGSYFEWY